MSRLRRFHALASKTLMRGIFLLVIAAVLFGVYLESFGFPEWLERRLLRSLSRGEFYVEADAIRLNLLKGLTLDTVRLYRKRVVGPPAIEASQVAVSVDLTAIGTDEPLLRELRIANGEFRPPMAFGPPGQAEPATAPQAVPRQQFRLFIENARVLGLDVADFSCDIDADAHGLTLDRIQGTLREGSTRGTCSGQLRYNAATNVVEVQLTTELDPHLLLPLIRAWEAPFTESLVQDFEFPHQPPRAELHFTQDLSSNGVFRLDGQLWLLNCRYMREEVLSANAGLDMTFGPGTSRVTVQPLTLVRKEGSAAGGFTVDTVRQTVQFDAMSSLDPKVFLKMAMVFTNNEMDVARFKGPTRLSARGIVDYATLNGTDFEGYAEGSGMGIGPFDTERCAFRLRMLGITNRVTGIEGRAYNGDFSGSATFVLPHGDLTNTQYDISGQLKGMDFAQFIAAVNDKPGDYKGTLASTFSVRGLLGEGNAATATGSGELTVANGRIFMLPVFGGLSDILTKVIPGLDFVLRQGDAKVDFTMAGGQVHSDRVSIQGDVLSLTGHGTAGFEGALDYDIQVTLMKEHTIVAKILRGLTYPISKLFEFRLRGTRAEPDWYLVNFSSDLLEKLHLNRKDKKTPAPAAK